MELPHHSFTSQQLLVAHLLSTLMAAPILAGQQLPTAIASQRQSLIECELAQPSALTKRQGLTQ
jgi:hypothetical protein